MKFTLIERRKEIGAIESFVFEPSESVIWHAGQYMHYVVPHDNADDRGIERWFTVSSAPFEGRPTITTRHTVEHGSSFKEKLFALEVGQSIEADGPEGDFTIEDPNLSYVFLAGGIGITPFHSMLKQADHEKLQLNVTLIYASRTQDILFRDELDLFATRNPNLKIHYVIDPQRIDENSVREIVPDMNTPLFYISGPEPMVKDLAEKLENVGVPNSNIKHDDFPGYVQY